MPTITADSIPDYDNWGPDTYWSCLDWVNWHKALKAKFGKDQANQIWTSAWDKQDSLEHNYNWCKYEGVFNKYVRENDLSASWWLPNILNDVTGAAEGVVKNSSDTVVNTAKVLKWVLPIVVVVVGISILVYAGKKTGVI